MKQFMSPRQVAFASALAAALAFAVVATALPFYTRAEPREANAARAMVAGRGLVVPERDGDRPSKKPPLYHWLAAAALAIGVEPPELAVRLPSVLLAATAVGVTAGIGAALHGPLAGALAGLVLGSSFEWFRAATQARVDMTLTVFLSLAAIGLWLGTRRNRPAWCRLGALAAGAATLAKGPVGIILPLGIVVLDAFVHGEHRRLRRLVDPVAAAMLLLPPLAWYVAAALHSGAGVLHTQLVDENVARFLGIGNVGHRHGLLYYPPLLAGGLLPWTLAVMAGVWAAIRRPGRVERFCLVWAAVVLAFFSVAAGKRSVYLLPAFPPMALLGGLALARWCRAPVSERVRSGGAAAAVSLVFAAVALALPPVQATLVAWAPHVVSSDREMVAPAFAVLAQAGSLVVGVAAGIGGALLVAVRARTATARGSALVVFGILLPLAITLLGTLPLARLLAPREFAEAVRRRVGPDAAMCALGPVPTSLLWYLDRPLPPCRLQCDRPEGMAWVLRTMSFDARHREPCLTLTLRHDGTGLGDSIRLDRVIARTVGEAGGLRVVEKEAP
ncbi:MAG: glycosyltransferase family 39 protein [bacterium]|nr:glycosyltransferase family 39 protein [bacterium]